jgi:nucleoside-diphosphate-sugar epimerase
MKSKKYLITGGTGFIGSALVKRLVKGGNKVVVLDNDIRGARSRLRDVNSRIEFIEADIRDADLVQKACRGVDSIIHLAYINGTEYFYKYPELVLEVAVKGMINIVDGCIKENVKELVLASSSEVYQTADKIPTDETARLVIPDVMNPRYSYGGGKIISELLAINYGRKKIDKVMIFRPHNIYGPDMGWEHVIPQFALRMKDICNKTDEKKIDFPIQGNGTQTRAFCYIDDFIDGLMLVLEKGEHLNIYHIGTQEEISIRDVAIEIGKFYNREVILNEGKDAKGATNKRCPDISKLKKMGYSPKILFKQGLKTTVGWYDKNSENLRKIKEK